MKVSVFWKCNLVFFFYWNTVNSYMATFEIYVSNVFGTILPFYSTSRTGITSGGRFFFSFITWPWTWKQIDTMRVGGETWPASSRWHPVCWEHFRATSGQRCACCWMDVRFLWKETEEPFVKQLLWEELAFSLPIFLSSAEASFGPTLLMKNLPRSVQFLKPRCKWVGWYIRKLPF